MKNFAARLLLGFLLLAPASALAQSTGTVVADCTTGIGLAYTPGSTRPMTLLPTGQACITGNISASLSGFTAASTGTPITATTGGATGSLPAGSVVVATNTGTTNAAYCALGGAATTASQYIAPNGGWFAFTVGASTQLTCATSTSTTTVNMTGGAGLPTGTGGGGGGSGGSSSITNWGGGTLGAMATYGTSPGAVLVPGVNAFITNTNANGQATMANSSPVTIASNQSANTLWGHGATAASVPANATYMGFNSGGNLTGPSTSTPLPVRAGDGTRQAVLDPCEANAQTYAPISITTATTTRIVAPSASNKTYICGLILVTAAANNIGIVEGTGGTCGSGTAGVIGGTTAANGPNYSANGGMVLQAGKTSHAQTAGTNVDLCLITSAATPLAGGIKYVQVP